MSKTIGVIFGGPSPEHDISILTGLQSVRILSKKYEVLALYWSKDNKWYLVDNEYESVDFINNKKIYKNKLEIKFNEDPGFYQKRKKLDFHVIVNACHGGPGEDGSLQSLLNIFDIKYTGPDQVSAQICMDKYAFYTLMKENDLPVIKKQLINTEEINIEGNYVLKPRFGGSSIGVEIINDGTTARKLVKNSDLYSQGAVIEKYLENSTDLLVGVRNFPDFDISEIEKPLKNETLFSYNEKYLENGGLEGSKRELPAKLTEQIEKKLIDMVQKINHIIPTRGIYRYDFLLHENTLYVNEINTIPGSHALYLWKNLDNSKFELLDSMVEEALSKQFNNWSVTGSDGIALKSAKDIASKLG